MQKQNSNDITQNLNSQLQDSILQKQSETIQKQAEELQNLSDMMQGLSLENSTLRKKLQEKSETIVSLNDKIGMLNSADLILKENEKLKRCNQELQAREKKAKEEASAMVSAAKKQLQQRQADLQSSIDAANAREAEALELTREERARIDHLAEIKISNTKIRLEKEHKQQEDRQNRTYILQKEELDRAYRRKATSLHVLTYGSVLYSFFATVLTAIKSQRICNDFLNVCFFLNDLSSTLWEGASRLGSAGWSVSEMIPYPYVNVICGGLLAVLGFLALPLGVIALMCFGVCKAIVFYGKHFAGHLSVLVALLSLALLMWFADDLSFIKWNLIGIYVLVHILYVFLRVLLTSDSNA